LQTIDKLHYSPLKRSFLEIKNDLGTFESRDDIRLMNSYVSII